MEDLKRRFAHESHISELSINGLLVNPFRGCTPEDMRRLVHDFMKKTGLDSDWTACFMKGAFLAQDKEYFTKERDLKLKDAERKALRLEDPTTGNKYDQPFILYALVACCSLGAAIQGWDETAINQAQTLPEFASSVLHLPNTTPAYLEKFFEHPFFKLGLLNSAPYLCCAVISCWLTDPLNRMFGRRGTIFICCIFSCVACVWQSFTNSWWQMFIARFCLGFGIGPKSATVPIYASECAPKEIRGGVVMMWQIWTALGILLGYLAGVVFQPVSGDLRWRLIVGSPMILPIIVCAYVFTLPESPRWLIRKARSGTKHPETYYEEAFRSLRRLRRSDLQAARDMFLIYHVLAAEETIREQHNRLFELCKLRRNRNALVASMICMFFQQFCGVNIFAYYSTLIFQRAGFRLKTAQNLSLGFGLMNFLFALPAIPLIDSFGRRSLLLATFPLMALFQLLAGLAFVAKGESRKVLVTMAMYLFCIAYSPGEGPVPFVYASESLPLYLRDLGMGATTSVNWFFNFILSITFPWFLNVLGPSGAFVYYAAWCAIGWWLILLFVPETRNQTLEELDARFSVPARVHARHALGLVRYYVRRYGIGRREAVRPKLDIRWREPEWGRKEVELRMFEFEEGEGERLKSVGAEGGGGW